MDDIAAIEASVDEELMSFLYAFGPEFEKGVKDPQTRVGDGIYFCYWADKSRLMKERGVKWRHPGPGDFMTGSLHNYDPKILDRLWADIFKRAAEKDRKRQSLS
jgi:hypothetical protein